MASRLAALARRFRQQAAFAEGYSPLYYRLFGAVAGWLEAPRAGQDLLVNWLLEAGQGRSSLEVSLLLNAGLHREVLAGNPVIGQLAGYFPTGGGDRPPDDPSLDGVLREAILNLRTPLGDFIHSAKVQTNETGRGLCWLLPLLSPDWPAVHLIDLGASAGLNLVAEKRAYRLVEERSGRIMLNLGQAESVQFLTQCDSGRVSFEPFEYGRLPAMLSRSGCDASPFHLRTAEDERTLMSFIWGDQVERLKRLREGLVAFREVAQSSSPVTLYEVELPLGLHDFLSNHHVIEDERPVVIYNTYMTSYLADKGKGLREPIEDWASDQDRPILWLQWEPARDGTPPPGIGWCAWTADFWQSGKHWHWLLGWAHPHGAQVKFGEGLTSWQAFWANRPQP